MTTPIEVPRQSSPLVTDDLGNTIKYLLSGSVFHQAIVTLTDAQIKTLPTTPVAIIAAPGVRRAIIAGAIHGNPEGLIAHFIRAANYTNLDTSAVLSVKLGTNGPAGTYGLFDNFLNYNEPATIFAFGSTDIYGTGQNYDSHEFYENLSVYIQINNASLGNLTGGHASNSLTITMLYQIYDINSGSFV